MSFTCNDIFTNVKRQLADDKLSSTVFLSTCKSIISFMYDSYNFPFFNDVLQFSNTTAGVNYIKIPDTEFALIKKINGLFFTEMKPENRKRKVNANLIMSIENSYITKYNDLLRNQYIYFDSNLSGSETIIIFYKKIIDIMSLTATDDVPFPDDFISIFESGVVWKLCPFSNIVGADNSLWKNSRSDFTKGLSQKIKDYTVSDDNIPLSSDYIVSNINESLEDFYNENSFF
jgi:hypothetical protein